MKRLCRLMRFGMRGGEGVEWRVDTEAFERVCVSHIFSLLAEDRNTKY